MTDLAPNSTPAVVPDKPLETNVGDIRTVPIAVAEEPVITIPAVDFAAAETLVNIMEAELVTMNQEAEADLEQRLSRLRKQREDTARKYLNEDKRLSCVAPADREAILQGLMGEFDIGLKGLATSYGTMLAGFKSRKTDDLLKLKGLLKLDGIE